MMVSGRAVFPLAFAIFTVVASLQEIEDDIVDSFSGKLDENLRILQNENHFINSYVAASGSVPHVNFSSRQKNGGAIRILEDFTEQVYPFKERELSEKKAQSLDNHEFSEVEAILPAMLKSSIENEEFFQFLKVPEKSKRIGEVKREYLSDKVNKTVIQRNNNQEPTGQISQRQHYGSSTPNEYSSGYSLEINNQGDELTYNREVIASNRRSDYYRSPTENTRVARMNFGPSTGTHDDRVNFGINDQTYKIHSRNENQEMTNTLNPGIRKLTEERDTTTTKLELTHNNIDRDNDGEYGNRIESTIVERNHELANYGKLSDPISSDSRDIKDQQEYYFENVPGSSLQLANAQQNEMINEFKHGLTNMERSDIDHQFANNAEPFKNSFVLDFARTEYVQDLIEGTFDFEKQKGHAPPNNVYYGDETLSNVLTGDKDYQIPISKFGNDQKMSDQVYEVIDNHAKYQDIQNIAKELHNQNYEYGFHNLGNQVPPQTQNIEEGYEPNDFSHILNGNDEMKKTYSNLQHVSPLLPNQSSEYDEQLLLNHEHGYRDVEELPKL